MNVAPARNFRLQQVRTRTHRNTATTACATTTAITTALSRARAMGAAVADKMNKAVHRATGVVLLRLRRAARGEANTVTIPASKAAKVPT